jgi:hypothetical protein
VLEAPMHVASLIELRLQRKIFANKQMSNGSEKTARHIEFELQPKGSGTGAACAGSTVLQMSEGVGEGKRAPKRQSRDEPQITSTQQLYDEHRRGAKNSAGQRMSEAAKLRAKLQPWPLHRWLPPSSL